MKRDFPVWVQVVLAFLAIFIAWRVLMVALGLVKFAVPILLIGGVAYMIYRANGGKALLGGRRSLP